VPGDDYISHEQKENGRLPGRVHLSRFGLETGSVSIGYGLVMAPRAYWKGYLKLSLVYAQALFPATSEREKISFHQLNKKTELIGCKILYDRYALCPLTDACQFDIACPEHISPSVMSRASCTYCGFDCTR
jgi:hypothetical protein